MKPCQTLVKESTQERARKRNTGQGPKSRQATSPKEAGHKEEREPLRTEPSTSGLKRIKLKNLPSLVSSVDYLLERVAVFTMHMGSRPHHVRRCCFLNGQ
jgi:hypothetical protein